MQDKIGQLLAKEMDKKGDEGSIIKWIHKNDIRNEKNDPISFDEHPFLVQIYTDNSNDQVQSKCAQVGSSTCAILKGFYFAKTKNYNIIHTLPTVDFSADFVKSKVDPMAMANRKSVNITKKTDSVRHKEIGLAHLFYRGTHKETEAITISADILINDEYDRSNLAVIDTFESRLDRSDYRRKWLFSNPTVPNYGIDYLYKESKQFHWMIKCSHCNNWHYMRYPDSLDFDRKMFICIKCRREITDQERLDGIWIAKYRGRETNGYWLSQLFCIWHDAASIVRKSKKQKKDVFYNFTLGVPYEGSEVSIKREHILRCISSNIIKPGPKAMGVDQGGTFYITVGTVDGIERMYTVGSWEEVAAEIAKNEPEICVIDGLPETNEVKKLQKKFGSTKVYPAFYKDKPDDPRTVRWERQTTDKRTSAVYIDRFRSLDDVINKVFKTELILYLSEYNPVIELVAKHFESMFRRTETNKAGQSYYVWRSSTKQDHWVHSINYYVTALDRISHLAQMDLDDEEDKRPYDSYETPDERLERLDIENDIAISGLPDYLGTDEDYLRQK